MLRKCFLLFTQLLLLCLTTNAAVFVVTSNADAGPGTLRQALLDAAANGSTEKDFIHFNLPDLSEAGRTITVINFLPDVSGNLAIDASTQPGINFGISSSKVCLNFTLPGLVPYTFVSALYISHVDDVEIYGLYLKNSTASQSAYLYGVKLENNKNIQIGAAGKGNVIFGFVEPISAGIFNHQVTFCENLTLKNNFIDIDVNGQNISSGFHNGLQLFALEGHTEIGGTPAEGNIFAAGLLIYCFNTYDSSSPGFINFKNNKIGVNYTQTKAFPESLGARFWGGKTTYNIEDNVITAGSFNALHFESVVRPIRLVRNYIGIDKTLQNKLPTSELAIFIRSCPQVFIGSDDAADANYITGCKPLYVWENSVASVNKNSFFCTIGMYPTIEPGDHIPITQIAITNVTADKVSGTATPNSSIELFYSDNCGTVCAPKTYFASTTTDANGKWEYTGVLLGPVIASATFNNSTSEFTNPHIKRDNIQVTSTCNGLGSIKGAYVSGAADIKWVNEHGTTVGTAIDLENVPAGKYKLIVGNGYCGDETAFYTIEDVSLVINTAQMQKTNASCNRTDGKITGISYSPAYPATVMWKNSVGVGVGNSIDLLNVPAGDYTLTITPADNSCQKIYGPITLINATGPNINQTAATTTPTNCGQSIGSITGITATGTGTLKYSWKNEQQQEVGTGSELLNQPAGKYMLQVTDDTQCGPVYTTVLEIAELNGITMDESTMVITVSSCSNSNGSITGLKAPGATLYKWTDVNNTTVGNALNLQNVATGDYTFTASNAFGCIKVQTYHVGQQLSTVYPVYVSTIVNACFGINNGSISISTNAIVKSARWTNAQDVTNGSGSSISNLAAGSYKLYFTDINGCETLYSTYNVTEIAELKIGNAIITNDECGLKMGSIKNLQVTGGVPPYSYSWFNSNNSAVGTLADIDHISGGVYRLVVTDSRNCTQPSATYTVLENSAIITPPVVNDIQTCSAGKITLTVNNSSPAYKYRLYDSEDATVPLDEQASGRFNIDVKSNTTYYISQMRGTCESERTQVRVTVGISKLDIANAFTPNADGINDYWKITGIENSPKAVVQVFNRTGQLVFNSKGYADPFNGTSNGRDLPIGNYYYIINMGSACSILSGTITIIR